MVKLKVYDQNVIKAARKLRKLQTPHEQKLWYYLRAHRFQGYKFRRQFPVGNFVADFCCVKRKLVIELDGSQHQQTLEADKSRDKYFALKGYRVLRIWNNDLDSNLEGVLTKVLGSLRTLSPNPSPKGRGE